MSNDVWQPIHEITITKENIMNELIALNQSNIERLAEKGVIRLPPMAFSENINNLGFAVKSEMYVFTGLRIA